ncbi:MAG TPA: hypothetical protein VH575_02970 [Gemmataceae bacterium]|jgi:plasmid stabilization system protein ParE
MRYTVVWAPRAENRLADIYNQALDKPAVTAASNEIDRLLANDADRKGRPLNGDRFLTVPPLTVIFVVSPDDCLVQVREVYRTS